MFKKLLILIITFSFLVSGYFFFGNNTSAGSIKVENIFSDINSNYKYLNELQTFYDRGMISPDKDGKFNPKTLLNRDEFVGILMEVTCKKCIQPNTSIDLINKYINSQVFYDINKQNKYFYCVEDANDSGFVKGYHPGTTCENGIQRDGEKPFCPLNTIILEEAIAVVLRASGILTNQQAEKVRQDIYNGIITEKIADDVSPKNPDGSVYSFYPDLAKALTYEVKEVDSNGNEKTYHLIEKKDNKLRPKQAISKEAFLRIAYVALKANACGKKQDNAIALKMKIFDKSCTLGSKNCSLSDLQDNSNTYDFGSELYTTCESGVKNLEGYIWRFYNNDNGNQIIKYGSYLDNYNFLNTGKWTVFLRVIDNCGNTAEVSNDINIGKLDKQISFGLEIDASPVYGNGPLDVDLTAKPDGGEGPYVCSWDYGDGSNGVGIEVNHIFENAGTYGVITTCNDKNGLTSTATSTIYVIDKNKEQTSFGLEVDASPVYGNGPLDVDLTAKPDGGEGPYVCSWDYGDGSNGVGIEVNHIFENAGTYGVITTCNDKNGLTSTASSIIYVVNSEKNIGDLKVSINADPIYGTGPLLVDFDGIVSGGVGPYSYSWDFGDGNNGYGKKIKNIFKNTGIYEVLLTITDSLGKTAKATVLIQVIGQNCNIDSDNDGVNNCDDVLPLVPGDKRNKGAPILERECNIDNDCKSGYICTNDTNVCLPKELATSCEYTGGDVLFGNVSCNTCPCNTTLDFISNLRKCDIIFPAITSPDGKQIYGKGELFQIK